MTINLQKQLFPALPLEEWEETKNTLHLFLQIVGKIRLATFPKKNHWWHVPFYVTSRGLGTGPIPYADFIYDMEFNFNAHVLTISSSSGSLKSIPLYGKTVATFYKEVLDNLSLLGVNVHIDPFPYDVPAVSKIPFTEDTVHGSYDKEYVHRYWQILIHVDSVFQEFRGTFIGKSTPVHLFWHHMDLALTRFSGKYTPKETTNPVEREAYSHEVISFGFWAGDDKVREPAFYAYAYPVPPGLFQQPIEPVSAFWNEEAGMALLLYNDVRKAVAPRDSILQFLESTYQTAARQAYWALETFILPSPL